MANFFMAASVVLIAASLVVSFLRLLRGPTVADRILALDLMTLILLPVIGVVAWTQRNGAYFDVALVYGLISFLAVLAAIRYLDLAAGKKHDEPRR
jgi:multicomponent Na+:H+ antiporter subunit F